MSEGRFNDLIIGDQMNGKFNLNTPTDLLKIYCISACECYVISKYCFEQNDMYGAITWSIQTYNKWTSGDQPNCVDIEQLSFQIVSSSIYTGNYNILTKYII